jgi:hypothetical protein
MAGVFLGMSCALLWFVNNNTRNQWPTWLCVVFVFAATTWVNSHFVAASEAATSNRQRCAAIQQEMLAARPRRSDLPEIFSALGCAPTGSEMMHFPIERNSTTLNSGNANRLNSSGAGEPQNRK